MVNEYQSQKIYIHFDKKNYLAGDTMWFKAYLYKNWKPDPASTNFYVQVSDNKGRIIATQKYPIIGASVNGNIELPQALQQGYYTLRAYTAATLNDDESFIYQKNIFISRLEKVAENKEAKSLTLNFFPESGYLVHNVLSVVAFKATDHWGNPFETNGLIKSDDGTTVAVFKTYHSGTGKIQFRPIAGKKYIAEVITGTEKRIFQLPEVVASGLNLKVDNEKEGKMFELSRVVKDKAMFDTVRVTADINNMLVYNTEVAFDDYPSAIGHIITTSLPSGILHFTVFDKNNNPLAERLSFVDNGEYRGKGDIITTKTGAGKKQETSFEIVFADSSSQYSCSASATDINFSATDGDENIFSSLLLSSDLKGHIDNPGWYFNNHNDSTKVAMDNLMLTHGWSRYSWKKILAKEFPKKPFTDGNHIKISGVVAGKDKKAVTEGTLSFFVNGEDSVFQSFDATVDANGHFFADSVIVRGRAEFYYTYTDKNAKKKEVIVVPDNNKDDSIYLHFPFTADTQSATTNPALSIPIAIMNNYKKIESTITQNTEGASEQPASRQSALKEVNEKYTTGVFKTMGTKNIDNINNPANDPNLSGVDFVKMNFLNVGVQNGRFVNNKRISVFTGQRWPVALFINEIPADLGDLQRLQMSNLALIKFYDGQFVGVGSDFGGGAIAVYTKDKNVEDFNKNQQKLDFFVQNGYAITKESFNPVYNTPASTTIADNRTTLFWSPNIITTPGAGTVKLNFFNNDFSKKIKIIVTGFNENGKLIHFEKIIE
jgi:hypothetical protein